MCVCASWSASTVFIRFNGSIIICLSSRSVLVFKEKVYVLSQRVHTARNADRCTSQRILYVHHSVTFRRVVQTNEDTIVRFLASGRTVILVHAEVKFIRIFAGDQP